jgi:hypothetical protein
MPIAAKTKKLPAYTKAMHVSPKSVDTSTKISDIPKPPMIPSDAFRVPKNAPDSVKKQIETIKRLNRRIRKIHWKAHREGTLSSISKSALHASCLGLFAMVMNMLAKYSVQMLAGAYFSRVYTGIGYTSTTLTAALMMDWVGWTIVSLASSATAFGLLGFSVASLLRLIKRMVDRRRTQGRLKKVTRLQQALTEAARTSKLASDGTDDLCAAVLNDLQESKRKVMSKDQVSQALIKDFDRVIEDVSVITANNKLFDDSKSNTQTLQNVQNVQNGGGEDPKRILKAARSLQATALRISRRA